MMKREHDGPVVFDHWSRNIILSMVNLRMLVINLTMSRKTSKYQGLHIPLRFLMDVGDSRVFAMGESEVQQSSAKLNIQRTNIW